MRIFLLLIVLSLSTILIAQNHANPLRFIETPNYKRQLLDLNFDLKQEVERRNNQPTNASPVNSVTGLKLNATYNWFKNAHNYQGNQSNSIDLNLSNTAIQPDNASSSKTHNRSTNINHYSNHRIYPFQEKRLIHILFNPEAQLSYRNYNRLLDNNVDQNNEGYNASIDTELGIGHGRIEYVSDARLLLFILEDLEKNKVLKRWPNDEEFYAIAQLMSYTKNQRFFDSRHQRIYEIEQFDSLLKKQNLITDHGVNYFTVVYDNWNYSVHPDRLRGFLKQLGVQPASSLEFVSFDNTSNDLGVTYSSKNTRHLINYFAFASIGWYNPISPKWQQDLRIKLNGGVQYNYNNTFNKDQQSEQEYFSHRSSSHLLININNTLGFYPTNRTYVRLITGCLLDYNQPFLSTLNLERNFTATLNAQLDSYYYISPQFRVQATYRLSADAYTTNTKVLNTQIKLLKNETLNSQLNISLTYMLF